MFLLFLVLKILTLPRTADSSGGSDKQEHKEQHKEQRKAFIYKGFKTFALGVLGVLGTFHF